MRKKNYYAFKGDFKKNMNKLITNRLKFDLKVKIYAEQNGQCLGCKEQINENQLLSHSSEIHIHYLVLPSFAKKLGLTFKFYEARKNKILLHKRCHLVLHKNKLFLNSFFLRTSIPEKSIVN